MRRYVSALLLLSLLCTVMSGCRAGDRPGGSTDASDGTGASTSTGIGSGSESDIGGGTTDTSDPSDPEPAPSKSDLGEAAKPDGEMFTDRDCEASFSQSNSIYIQLNGDSATASSNSVKISGTTVTITENATHILSGTLKNGRIVVNAKDTAKLQLVLNGVDITSQTSAALYILEADKVFVTLADGTVNRLSNGGSFTAVDESNIDAAVFSKQDLTLNGSGCLTVTSPGGHGIVCKDDLVLTGGTYQISSASHGLDANDSVRITGQTQLTIDAGKDGIHAENTDDASLGFVFLSGGILDIEAEGDGISAGSYARVEGGTVDLLAGGGSVNGTKESSGGWGGFMGGGRPGQKPISTTTQTEDTGTSMKGLKAADSIQISGGTLRMDCADDCIHADKSVTISGGTFELASGDDAIHAEEALTITAGTILISESYEGLEGLDISVQGGDIRLVASDDGLNAAGGTDSSGMTGGRDGMFGGRGPGGMGGGMGGGMSSSSKGSIVISGGTLYVNASGDGIDANGTLEISGGYTVVVGPTQGDTATLDYDTSAVMKGGTFIGTGASGMAQTFSDPQQGVIAVQVGSRAAGTQITLKDSAGKTLIEYAPELSFAVVILSSPDIKSGGTYTITVGSDSGTFQAD